MSESGCSKPRRVIDIIVEGQLAILGTMSSLKSTNTLIKDHVIELNYEHTGTNNYYCGLLLTQWGLVSIMLLSETSFILATIFNKI
jgi:hypothetical protein